MQVALETLRLMKQANLDKPEGVSQHDWEVCDSDVVNVGDIIETNALVVTQPTNTAVAQTSSNEDFIRRALTLDDLENEGMAVDVLMKIKTGSLFFGDDEVVAPIKAKVLFEELRIKQSIKVEVAPGKTEYYHTYDGVNEVRGGTFDSKVRYCMSKDPNAYTYKSIDLVMELVEDVKDSRGKVVAEAGTRFGHSTSSTAKKSITDFIKSCKRNGIDTENGEAIVMISLETKKNDKFTWKIPTFELVTD